MKTKRFLLAAGIVLIGALYFLIPLFTFKDLELPNNLGSLHLRNEIRGEKARKLINELHGKSVTPKDNLIALYGNNDGGATAYLSVYDNRSQSEEIFQRMLRSIEKGTSPFTNLKRFTLHGHDVSFCVGFGQAHYFFFVDESVYWLTADLAVAEEAASELLLALKGRSIAV